MKIISLIAAAALCPGLCLAQDEAAAKPAEPPPAKPAAAPEASHENVSYAIGALMAGTLKQWSFKPDMTEFSKGITDTLEGKKPKMTDEQCQAVFQEFQKGNEGRMRKAGYEKALASGDKNAVASRDFLAKNGERKGVTTTASGLQYEVMKPIEGGAKPKASDTVKVHYHGTLPDGTVFDSSVQRNEPISFPLTGVIPGWTEGVQLMPVGSKFKFFIPSWLAYADRGSPPAIPGHSALVFEVELLAIE